MLVPMRALLATILACGTLAASTSSAQVPSCHGTDPSRAASALEEGDAALGEAVRLRSRHRDERAAQAFERALAAYDAACTAGTDVALERRAIPLVRLGRPLEAIESLDAFIALHPLEGLSEADRARVESNLQVVEREVATLIVIAEPEADVLLDGAAVGRTPLPRLRRLPGDVELTLRASGHVDAQRRVTLVRGESYRLEVRLEPEPVASAEPVGAASPVLEPAPRSVPPPPAMPSVPVERGPDRFWGWAVGAGAVAAVAFAWGITGAVQMSDARNQLGGACFLPGSEALPGCADTRSRYDLGVGLAASGFPIGGALLITAISLGIVDALSVSGAADGPTVRLDCGLGVGSATCRGTF